jgi:hypothetical protein
MSKLTAWAVRMFQWPFLGRQRRLMRDRGSYTRADFAAFFTARGVPQQITDEVWNALVAEAAVEDFRPKPEDDLIKTFGLADEDLDEDVVLPLLERCGCRIPAADEVSALGPVATVGDLVGFIARLKH